MRALGQIGHIRYHLEILLLFNALDIRQISDDAHLDRLRQTAYLIGLIR